VAAVQDGTFAPIQVPEPADAADDSSDDVAVISIIGQMTKGESSFGGTSSVQTREAIRKAVDNEAVRAILLHIDSPGGTVAGTADLAAEVRNANAVKPVYAYIEDLGASAAYWVASQARRVYANATAEVGSIGTYAVIEDTSGVYDKAGAKVHVISTGEFKGAFADGAPVTDRQLASVQVEVDDLNEHFLNGVVEGRGITREAVNQLADGRVWIADKAQQNKLIDGIATLDDAVAALHNEVTNMETIEGLTAKLAESEKAIAAAYERGKADAAPKPATVNELRTAFPDSCDSGFVIDQLGVGATLAAASVAYISIARDRAGKANAMLAEAEKKLAVVNDGQGPIHVSIKPQDIPADPDAEARAAYKADPTAQAMGTEAEFIKNFATARAQAGNVRVFKK
jgi:signal peptide peptidase SppA